MKNILKYLFFGCFFNALCGEESLTAESHSSRTTIQVVPYIYGQIFQPGYGLSVRTQVSGHALELAPMVIPPSRGYFGSSTKRIGFSCSYYHAFLRKKFYQPYLGCSYTHLRDLHRSITRHYDGKNSEPYKVSKDPIDQENIVSNLIGIQFHAAEDSKYKDFPGYLFINAQGPITVDKYGLRLEPFFFPRVGAGFQF
jgi:hypothetical protein